MKLGVCESLDALNKLAALEVAKQISLKPASVLGLPTGETPIGMYRELVNLFRMRDVDFSKVRTFNLDEYIGISGSHPCSYNSFMRTNLFDYVNILKENIHIPDGLAEFPDEECKRYEKLIKKSGGIDLLVLGIGHNGHIGFNEPRTSFDTETHVVNLALNTIEANARFFDSLEDVPRKAITMGIKTIMEAKRILLLASGQSKSQIIYDAFTKEVTPNLPASVLQRHKDVYVMLDESAASLLKKSPLP